MRVCLCLCPAFIFLSSHFVLAYCSIIVRFYHILKHSFPKLLPMCVCVCVRVNPVGLILLQYTFQDNGAQVCTMWNGQSALIRLMIIEEDEEKENKNWIQERQRQKEKENGARGITSNVQEKYISCEKQWPWTFCNASEFCVRMYVCVYVYALLLLELLIKTQQQQWQQNRCQEKTARNLYMVKSINFCARIPCVICWAQPSST